MVRRTVAGGAIVLVLILLVLGVRGCLNARKERHFKDYARDVAELVDSSNQESRSLFDLLSKGGSSPVDVETQVNGFAVEADQLVDRARSLDPPDELKEANRYLVETLEFRRDGTRKIASLLRTALGDEGRSEATAQIAGQMRFFDASDVIYSQRVVPAMNEAYDKEGLLDEVAIPQSAFLRDIDWLRPGTVADRINRIRGGGGGGPVAPGLHGTGLVGVTVQPSGTALQPGGAAEIKLAAGLAFDVQVQNQGENEERDVTVRVTISGGRKPLTFEERISSLAAGQTKTVRIPIADTPPIGQPAEITVESLKVPGEQKTDNNKLTARAIFSR